MLKKNIKYIFVILSLLLQKVLFAQPDTWKGDSWAEVSKNKSGTVTALWYDIEPFIYLDDDDKLIGVEYEVMESLKKYLKDRYAIDLEINWVNAGSFENIYAQVKQTTLSGVFGWSYYSITPERKKEVKFTPPYMPDLNVLITNNSEPVFNTAQEFIGKLSEMKAYTMESTTMEDDIKSLQKNFYSSLQVITKNDDYEILQKVSKDDKAFGYVPLSVYIVGLQKGIKVKRQNILISRREGFAAVMPFNTDWTVIMNEYFSTNEFKILSGKVVGKYLGNDVTDLVFGASTADSLIGMKNDLNLLAKEKEIVTKRLIDTAIDAEKEKFFRSILITGAVIVLVFISILYNRYISKQRFYKLLQQRNDTIIHQKEDIEVMNKKLEMKVLLAQMNPHLIFNSLNAIQYFVTLDERKNAIKYINNFSRHLRLILNNASAITITMENEVKMLKQYLQLEQLRFENKFDFIINHDEDLNWSTEIPSMLIYPYVEAALYQGVLLKKAGRGHIEIDFSKKADYLLVTILYNGEGKAAATSFLAKREGNEFTNSINTALQHIDLLNYRQKKKVSVQQIDLFNEATVVGTKVVISIPLGGLT
jgi:ABC-type amino acid transport substrate-binding protein